ncbi:MAG: UDP-3-O-(3-hydroxymyristoyl)glucosamine N-acyltransferase [Bacteroidales bacterium]|nr:UDP-3-O-(3-hydroxymyristoyl)glucosamine N-acyltransferase [Bacteroidales bacterium]
MEFKVAQIAGILQAEVVGDPNGVITTVCKIEEGVPGGLTFLANPKYTHYIYETRATAAIVNKTFQPERPVPCTLIKVDDSYVAFARLLDVYNQSKRKRPGVSPHACVAESAKIGENVYIGEFASIGENVVIGDNCQIFPHVCLGDDVKVGSDTVLNAGVKVYAECVIGNHCIIHAGAVIGADGFGFAPQNGDFIKVPQIGNVRIEDNVEIGANTCIDRSTMGSTLIHKNVKLDNLIQIAHNVEIGEGSAFAAQVGVAGSAKIGAHCIIAGQGAVAGHITVGDGVLVGGQSAVTHSIPGGKTVLGSPAIPVGEEKRLIIYRKKLPELYARVDAIEKKLSENE